MNQAKPILWIKVPKEHYNWIIQNGKLEQLTKNMKEEYENEYHIFTSGWTGKVVNLEMLNAKDITEEELTNLLESSKAHFEEV